MPTPAKRPPFLRFLAETFIEAVLVTLDENNELEFLRFLAETFIEAKADRHVRFTKAMISSLSSGDLH